MTDEHADKTVRLLDIIYELYGDDKTYPYRDIPFEVTSSGFVILSHGLYTELQKDENADLMDWAHDNIVSLFE